MVDSHTFATTKGRAARDHLPGAGGVIQFPASGTSMRADMEELLKKSRRGVNFVLNFFVSVKAAREEKGGASRTPAVLPKILQSRLGRRTCASLVNAEFPYCANCAISCLLSSTNTDLGSST